jgi:hypothetical protein
MTLNRDTCYGLAKSCKMTYTPKTKHQKEKQYSMKRSSLRSCDKENKGMGKTD